MNTSHSYPWLSINSLKVSEIEAELQKLTAKVRHNMTRFNTQFPSASSQENIYRIKGNDDWTNGFWTGIQAICFEFSGDRAFLHGVQQNLQSFKQRLDDNIVLEHHDIGFLYSLSAGALYAIDKAPQAKRLIISAADILLQRYQPRGQFIQAWGDMNDPQEYRLIIDSLLNLPLLYQASRLSHDDKYKRIADIHFNTVIATIFRANFSSFHTYYFDSQSGAPLEGKTFQGFSDDSCWARGQAWAILGLPLVWRLSGQRPDRQRYNAVCYYFLSHLPQDAIPYWDLSFKPEDSQPRDTSALAIAICGLIQGGDCFDDSGYYTLANKLLAQLSRYASASHDTSCEGLLKHGVYAYSQNKGVDECNLWGDYFYMEALYRVYNPTWQGYW